MCYSYTLGRLLLAETSVHPPLHLWARIVAVHFASTAAEVRADAGDEMLAVNEQDVKNFHISDFLG